MADQGDGNIIDRFVEEEEGGEVRLGLMLIMIDSCLKIRGKILCHQLKKLKNKVHTHLWSPVLRHVMMNVLVHSVQLWKPVVMSAELYQRRKFVHQVMIKVPMM